MIHYTQVEVDQETAPEARLWQAVIASTIMDWVSGPLRQKRQAEQYLFEDNTDFPKVCESAGMDVARLRAKLEKHRNKNASSSALAA